MIQGDCRTFEGLASMVGLLKQYAADELASAGHTLEAAQACVMVVQEMDEVEDTLCQLRQQFAKRTFGGATLSVEVEDGGED